MNKELEIKRNNLLQIKSDIEAQFENKSDNITPCELNTIATIFSECLIMNKAGETIQEAVAQFYQRYPFIAVYKRGVGFAITYTGDARKVVYGVYKYGECFDYKYLFNTPAEADEKIEQLGASNHDFDTLCLTSDAYVSEIYENLQAGFSYSDGFSGIVKYNRNGDVGIRYNHYGSSAQENTLSGLKWVLEHIFNDVVDFTSKYKLGHGFVNCI